MRSLYPMAPAVPIDAPLYRARPRPLSCGSMPFVRVGDLRMYYELGGNGPRVLFINGTGGDLRARPGPFDGPLAGRFELLAHDQRGLGQTDRPDVPYAMA